MSSRRQPQTLPTKRSNWRQQQVRDQLGHNSASDGQKPPSEPPAPPPRITMAPQKRIAPLRLNFVIVGGSLGGLAAAYALSNAGHYVHVIEQKEGLIKNACGIRIPPNLTRILERWGIWPNKEAIKCWRLAFRKLHTGEFVGDLEYKEEVMKVLGADFWLMHYSDLLQSVYDLAIGAGAVVQFSTSVIDLDPSTPSVHLSTGEVLRPDIVIGADGYQSIVQRIIEQDVIYEGGEPYERKESGTVIYSFNVDVSDITPESDPESYETVHQNEWTAYMGPYISILTSPSRDYKEFSIQMFIPDVPDSDDTWDNVLPMEQVNTSSLPPRLLKLCQRASHAVETKFIIRQIEDWVHPDAKTVLLGESAHPQIPSSTHSGSLAVEDAAVLGDLFSRIRSRDQIRPFLYGYQELRAERCWTIQQSESANSASVMLPDGPEQEQRDKSMRDAYSMGRGGWDERLFRHLWENIRILFAYDPEEEVEEWWQQWGLLRERAEGSRLFSLDDDFEEEKNEEEVHLKDHLHRMSISGVAPPITVTVESTHTY